MRVFMLGVKQEFQHLPLGALLYAKTWESGLAAGMQASQPGIPIRGQCVLSLNLARHPWLSTRLTILGASASSWLATLRFTSDAEAPTLESPTVSGRAAGGIFFFGSKAQRSEPFRKKMMPAASPCAEAQVRRPCNEVARRVIAELADT